MEAYPPHSTFRTCHKNQNQNNISNIINPSYNLPLLPHGGTKLAFGHHAEGISQKVVNESHKPTSHIPLQLTGNRNEASSNHHYEVPFSQYSSVNNLTAPRDCNLSHHTSFQPSSKTISAEKTMHYHFKNIVSANFGKSLPSLLDSSGYIHNHYNQNQNLKNDIRKGCKTGNRVQPQGFSSSNSISSNMEKQMGNHIHVPISSNYLGNI